jgi:hypothetical protein
MIERSGNMWNEYSSLTFRRKMDGRNGLRDGHRPVVAHMLEKTCDKSYIKAELSRVAKNSVMTSVGPETRMKAAVIDRLIEAGQVNGDAVLISEMMVANWARRADIVLANGKLWGFELKSESDRLTRLSGQIESFSFHFEKFVVVVAERFESRARALLPDGAGLWIAQQDGTLKERIRPKVMPLTKEAAITLMTASELRRLLACNGCSGIKDAARHKLEELAFGLPASDLSNAARHAVKCRHRQRHNAFLEQRHCIGTISAISSLRKYARTQKETIVDSCIFVPLPEVLLSKGHPLLVQAPAGPVLKRAIKP